MARSLYIAGSGSFAAEIAEWAADSGVEIAGLIESRDPRRVGSMIHGFPVVALEPPSPGAAAILALGGDRHDNWRPFADAGWTAGGVIHPTAHVAHSARVSPSATIGPLAVVGAGAEIGDQAILSRGSLVGHHARIGEFVSLNPGVNVGANSEVAAAAYLGMGCVIVSGISIGTGSTVAAGAVTVRDVPAEARVQGVPARPFSRE